MGYSVSSLRLTEEAWEALDYIYERRVEDIGMKVSKTEIFSQEFVRIAKEIRDEKSSNDISDI
tara:strand:- start:302 stop:490 length:189 start_codon:yes stop_codon:yes gene_type:complete